MKNAKESTENREALKKHVKVIHTLNGKTYVRRFEIASVRVVEETTKPNPDYDEKNPEDMPKTLPGYSLTLSLKNGDKIWDATVYFDNISIETLDAILLALGCRYEDIKK